MSDNMDMQFVQGYNSTDYMGFEKKPTLSEGEEILDMGDDFVLAIFKSSEGSSLPIFVSLQLHSTIAKSMLMLQVFPNFQTSTLCKSSLTGKQRFLH